MKTIASLKGPGFLRACNKTKHAVADFLATTGAYSLWKELRARYPDLPEDLSEEEKNAENIKRGKEIINVMMDKLLDEEAEATYALLCTMIVPEHKKVIRFEIDPESGEEKEVAEELEEYEEPDGFDLIAAAVELVCTPKVMAFFFKLAKLVPEIMGD